jgi:hypothetical protein
VSEAPDRELEAEVRALLRPVREPPAAPAEVKARALRRLALALPIGGGGGHDGGSRPQTPGPQTPGPATGLGRALVAKVPAWSLLASFVAGAAAMLIARPPPHEKPLPVAVAVTTALPPSATAAPIIPILSPPVPPSAPAAPVIAPVVTAEAPRPSARPVTDDLEAERALLDVARTALGRGDGGNALRAAEEHGRRFPHGILAEEREAMSIQALRLLHRDDDAQARLSRFRGRFPTSLMRPALEATDGGTP